jgi:endonuclease/exonuclease/phosphatase family metal-dependent hydrolase
MKRLIVCMIVVLCSFLIGVSATETPAPQLRVLTYNIHHGQGTDGKFDYQRLATIITSVKPDVVALQEVDCKTRRASGVDQAALLGKLTGMKSAYGRSMYFSGGEYGQAILSRFPIVEAKAHPLPFNSGDEPRTVLIAKIAPDNGLPEILFAGTHLCHRNEERRTDQARQINLHLPEKGDTPAILAGDLNARKESKPMQELLDKRWIDATEAVSRIDYILLRPNDPWRVVAIKSIDERVASDHKPVLAVLEWVDKD